ncbi:caspase family protein [Rhizobium sp. RCAM05350]|nr:caspase family protein [Rhizobium sp. RCAM05350]
MLIGIGTYENLPEDMFLHGPKNDVKAIRQLLTETLSFKPEAIRVLTDEKATRQAMLSSMDEWLVAGTVPGDRVYLYFSGHGLQVKDASGDEEDGMDEAISTYDIKADETDWTNVILDDDLEAVLEKLKGRAVTLVIDACHSGTISRSLSPQAVSGVKGARYLPRPFARTAKQSATRGLRIDLGVVDKPAELTAGGLTAWSAAAAYQVAWDDVRLPIEDRHGVFTSAYIAGYTPGESDANSNGLVSNAELFEYVTKKSKEYCSALENCDNLDPQLESLPEALGTSVATPEPYKAEQAMADQPQDKPEPVYQKTKVEAGVASAYVDADPVVAIGDIVGKVDTGDVTVSLDSGPMLKNGQAFKISVTSKYDGNLVLLDVNGEGIATQIFPNDMAQKITPLTAGSTLTIPDDYYGFDFEADGQGENMLVAIVVSDAVDLKGVAPSAQGLTAELDARQSLSEIVSRLQKAWTGDAENRSVRWSLGTLKYTIE